MYIYGVAFIFVMSDACCHNMVMCNWSGLMVDKNIYLIIEMYVNVLHRRWWERVDDFDQISKPAYIVIGNNQLICNAISSICSIRIHHATSFGHLYAHDQYIAICTTGRFLHDRELPKYCFHHTLCMELTCTFTVPKF